MSKTKVTVVMNFYNEEKYLPQAIESILNQTYSNFELLLIDDASTDKSNDIAHSYTDPRIRVIRNSINKGPAYSRNVGMQEAKGEYIAFADSDDYYALTRLEKEVACLEKNKIVLGVSCWANYIDDEGKIIKHEPWTMMDEKEIKASFLIGNPFMNPGAMIRREVFEKYSILQKEDLRVSQDYYFWLRILEIGELKIIPEKLLFYRVHNSKAKQNANKDKAKYDDLMKELVHYAWKSYGFDVNERDIHFIYHYFFKRNFVWRIQEFIGVYKIWKKISGQLNRFSDIDRKVVKKIFIDRFNKINLYFYIMICIKNKTKKLILK